MNDLGLAAFSINFIVVILKAVAVVLICEVIVDIIILNSFFSFLFYSENQIQPARQI